jgi:gluconolactonase
MRAAPVADGIPFAEGPVWCPDGTLVVTSVQLGGLFRVRPVEQRAEQFADTAGGANGAALAADGSIVVTQNGGLDLSSVGLESDAPFRPVTPGLQLVSPAGEVTYLTDRGLLAPNDLVVAPDGTIYFTDPPPFPPPDDPVGRVMAYTRDGQLRVVATDFSYCNGIGLDRDGLVVVIEARGLQRLLPDGGREWVVERLGRGGGDGFCVDADGRFYVAATIDHGVRVIEPDGTEIDFLSIDGPGITTNCCFGGADGRTLFATDAVPGAVVAWESMPTPGLALTPWPGPT